MPTNLYDQETVAKRPHSRRSAQLSDQPPANPMYIETLHLLTNNIPAQLAFYRDTLGVPIVAHSPTSITVQAGATRLTFAAAPAGWAGAYHFAFNIPENQLAEAKLWLAARTPLATNAAGEDEFDFRNWDARAVYGYDAGGNIVELIARHALANASDAAFVGRSLLNVSEIGLASPNVPATVRHMEQMLGVGVFRGTTSPSFAAVGDEAGLFIIVSTGRPWYPDQRVRAEPLPLTATVAVPGGRRFQIEGPSQAISAR